MSSVCERYSWRYSCVTVNEKTYVRKLKDMTCFKGATFAHLEKTSLVFSSSSFAVLVNPILIPF